MNSRLELSPQIEKARYANFPWAEDAGSNVFMVGYEECSPDYRIVRERFPFWSLEFVVGGKGYFKEVSQRQTLGHGSIFCYGPEMAFEFWNEAERPFKKYFMVAGGEACPTGWLESGLALGKVQQLGNVAPIISIFDQIINEGEARDGQTQSITKALHEQLVALIRRHQVVEGKSVSGSRKAYELSMEVLQQDYRTLNSLADLAKRSGYSAEYLCRIFKIYHAETPYRVLTQRKMTAAWLLLRDGRLQVGAVARELGYEDPLHFSRVFRRIMGCAPSSVGQQRV